MSAWVGRVKALSFKLEDIQVVMTDEDRILALTNGLDDSYGSFVISLDATPVDQFLLLTVCLTRTDVSERMQQESVGLVPADLVDLTLAGAVGRRATFRRIVRSRRKRLGGRLQILQGESHGFKILVRLVRGVGHIY
jgi:hypothetical protein